MKNTLQNIPPALLADILNVMYSPWQPFTDHLTPIEYHFTALAVNNIVLMAVINALDVLNTATRTSDLSSIETSWVMSSL